MLTSYIVQIAICVWHTGIPTIEAESPSRKTREDQAYIEDQGSFEKLKNIED